MGRNGRLVEHDFAFEQAPARGVVGLFDEVKTRADVETLVPFFLCAIQNVVHTHGKHADLFGLFHLTVGDQMARARRGLFRPSHAGF